MKKFDNIYAKINVVKDVLKEEGKLTAKDISDKIARLGYSVDEKSMSMFIYHRMLHKHVKRENRNGINFYALIN